MRMVNVNPEKINAASIEEGSFIRLLEPVESLEGEEIPEDTICEVIEIKRKMIKVETLDDQLAIIDNTVEYEVQ